MNPQSLIARLRPTRQVQAGALRGPDSHFPVLAARAGHDVASLCRTQRSHGVLVGLDGFPEAPGRHKVDEYRAILCTHPDLQDKVGLGYKTGCGERKRMKDVIYKIFLFLLPL